MEQIHEIDLNSISEPECARIEVCIEIRERAIKLKQQKEVHKVPIKTRLLKLMNKSKYNAKYVEQVIPIQRLERERVQRNYGIW